MTGPAAAYTQYTVKYYPHILSIREALDPQQRGRLLLCGELILLLPDDVQTVSQYLNTWRENVMRGNSFYFDEH